VTAAPSTTDLTPPGGTLLARWARIAPLYQGLLAVIIWLFFFNALLDRLATFFLGRALFTTIYYAIMGTAVAMRVLILLRHGRDQALGFAAAGLLALVTVLGVTYGDPVAGIYGVKQFFIGVVYLFLFAGQPFPASTLVRALLLVQAYALFQAIYFYVAGFTLPPWDMTYVQELFRSWEARTIYQGDLIRPFATFASYSEYQIVVHTLTVGVFLLRERLSAVARAGTWALVLSVVVVDVLLPERTPILMAGIMLATTWLGLTIVHGARFHPARLPLGIALLGVLAALFWIVPALFLGSEVSALQRFAEGFRFWEAESVRDRAATAWSLALDAIRSAPEGSGPAAVNASYNPAALVPHSSFLLWAIGYSIAFPFVFVGWIAVMFRRVYGAILSASAWRARLGLCGLGVTLAYLVSSIFNATFSSYSGVAFFLLMQWLHAGLGPSHRLSAAAAGPS